MPSTRTNPRHRRISESLELAAAGMRAQLVGAGPVEFGCTVLPNAYHSDGPCGPEHHPAPVPLEHAPELRAAADELARTGTITAPLSPALQAMLTPPTPAPPVGGVEPFRSERQPELTWRSRHDVRSLAYGVRARLAGSAPLVDHLWPVGEVLDQGSEGACVGFAVVDAVNAFSIGDIDRGPAAAEALYKRAQQLDTVPGESYSGTSVLAGMQAAVEAGLIGGYLWAFGTRDVAQAVLQRGPVVVGMPWLSGMYDTGPGGLVQLTGDDTGAGHCLAVVGIKLKGPQGQPGPYFVWQNSWGPSYGHGGLGYVHHRDLAQLLHGVGEAAIPTAGPVR